MCFVFSAMQSSSTVRIIHFILYSNQRTLTVAGIFAILLLIMSFEEISKKITPILKACGAEYAAVFGSAARGEAKPDSDVDILVRFQNDISLLDHIGVAYELGDTIGQKVDLITEQSLNKHVAENVKKDLKVIYGQGQRPDLL